MKKLMLTATIFLGSYAHAQIDINDFKVEGVLTPPPPFETVMARNDLNKDGLIMKDEALQAGTLLGKGFEKWDPNKDGKIDATELHLIIDTINAALGEQGKNQSTNNKTAQ